MGTTDVLGSVAKSMEVLVAVSTSLFSTSKLPQTVDVETATKGVQLNADQLQSLKQSFVNANKPNTATPSIDSSSNQDDLDSGIISSKPGAGLLWDKPYLSSLKESFEASLADASVSGGSDADTSSSGSGVPEIDI